MALLDDLRVYLAAECGWTAGTDFFGGDLPAAPDTVTAIFVAPGGRPPVRTFRSDTPVWRRPRLIVMTRAADWATAYDRHQQAYAALEKVVNEDLNGVRYARIENLVEPHDVGKDENDRDRVQSAWFVWRDGSVTP